MMLEYFAKTNLTHIKMRKYCILLLLLISTIGLQKVSLAKDITILSVGDSITAGLKLNGSQDFWFCPANGVVTSTFQQCNGNGVLNRGGFQPDLRAQFAQNGIDASIYNWGFAGEESFELFFRVVDAMETRPADYVFILAGVNDLNDNFTPQFTAFNIVLMMEAVLERGLIPIVGTITPHLGDPSFNPKIELINSFIRFHAEELNVAVAEHYQALIGSWVSGGLNSGDGLHVSDAGDAVIAREWVKAFEISQTLNQITITPILQLLLD